MSDSMFSGRIATQGRTRTTLWILAGLTLPAAFASFIPFDRIGAHARGELERATMLTSTADAPCGQPDSAAYNEFGDPYAFYVFNREGATGPAANRRCSSHTHRTTASIQE